MRLIFSILLPVLLVGATAVNATTLQQRVTDAVEHEALPGLAIYVVPARGEPVGAAAGQADPDGRSFASTTPVRIASVTKTYVAATVLRLWEQGRIDLDAAISQLVDQRFDDILKSDGYDTKAITVRHLLMHTAGLPDHADQQYVQIVAADPQRVWTREEQVALNVANHDPLAAPGEVFEYSDTGYVLLGHIIERVTQKSLAASVRHELDFESLGLEATWWEVAEPEPEGLPRRAHQYVGNENFHHVNASVDLYGGGGLLSTPRDMALFFAALLRGKVFENADTLKLMMDAPGHPNPDQYRMGLSPQTMNGHIGYGHTGFWGTAVYYFPDLDVAIAGAVLEQGGFRTLLKLMDETLIELEVAEN